MGSPDWLHWLRPIPPKMAPFLAAPDIMRPRLATAGLEMGQFEVMRRTHSSLMKELKVDPKIVADQLGHTVDENQNVYTQTAVEIRQAALNQLEKRLLLQ